MSRVVVGYIEGKPVYRDDGPTVAIRRGQHPGLVQPVLIVHRPGRAVGLPCERVLRETER